MRRWNGNPMESPKGEKGRRRLLKDEDEEDDTEGVNGFAVGAGLTSAVEGRAFGIRH
jgi:hypothetical protein